MSTDNKNQKYITFMMWIPKWMEDKEVIEMLQFNDVKVDDTCSYSRNGHLVEIWIPIEETQTKRLKDKVGGFIK